MRMIGIILAGALAMGTVVATSSAAQADWDGNQRCDTGEFCIYTNIDRGGTVYSYRYGKEDWNWHDGVVPAPANQDSSWENRTAGPLKVQIYKYGGNDRGGLRTPTICLWWGGTYVRQFPSASDQGSGHLFQQDCHPDSAVF
ncbi:peptidase inhibitor family I36 protein [Nonomuraea sp. NPDC046802]|uniref:peptidase inhibitor family I36 protein n=1 Tax=Nonomuraea sp. NPDC046802 TaxID=3154919 RepID=UPI0033C35D21